MLTRLYIDNFRCFVNFEYKPARRQLIFGSNGAGKSSFLDALWLLQQVVWTGNPFDDFSLLSQRTRWLNQPQQVWDLEAVLGGARYVYRLVIEPSGELQRARVYSETLDFDGKPIFEFTSGKVHFYDDQFERKVAYDLDSHRSGLATIPSGRDTQRLSRFKLWIGGLFCFRLNPFAMGSRAEREDPYPKVDLSNFAARYRNLSQAEPEHDAALFDSLRACWDGFGFLQLQSAGENVRLLTADFGGSTRLYFGELSDRQRCLTCLYAILHFVLAKGYTVILDEPDNFVSLREIQPWLMAVTDTVEEAKGQILIISHHPEILNQWAPDVGVRFVREGVGPVRVVGFRGDPASPLTPSELVARGWERE